MGNEFERLLHGDPAADRSLVQLACRQSSQKYGKIFWRGGAASLCSMAWNVCWSTSLCSSGLHQVHTHRLQIGIKRLISQFFFLFFAIAGYIVYGYVPYFFPGLSGIATLISEVRTPIQVKIRTNTALNGRIWRILFWGSRAIRYELLFEWFLFQLWKGSAVRAIIYYDLIWPNLLLSYSILYNFLPRHNENQPNLILPNLSNPYLKNLQRNLRRLEEFSFYRTSLC